eukprot:g15216.t1
MFGRSTKLVIAVPQRWISSAGILNWEALEKRYSGNERGGVFPLAVHKVSIEELYSIMKPVAVLIKDSQATGGPTGLATHVDLCILRADTLDPRKPLPVQVPRKKHGGCSTTTVVSCTPEGLQNLTTQTRTMLAEAIDTRYFGKHYNEFVATSTTPDYLFEMAACMSPSLCDEHYAGLPLRDGSVHEPLPLHPQVAVLVVQQRRRSRADQNPRQGQVPASSAVLERDFSTAARVLSPSRSRMGAEYVEMTLFLNGSKNNIPREVPSLSEGQAKEALPRRLTDPTKAVLALSSGEDEVEAEAEAEAEAEEEQSASASSYLGSGKVYGFLASAYITFRTAQAALNAEY